MSLKQARSQPRFLSRADASAPRRSLRRAGVLVLILGTALVVVPGPPPSAERHPRLRPGPYAPRPMRRTKPKPPWSRRHRGGVRVFALVRPDALPDPLKGDGAPISGGTHRPHSAFVRQPGMSPGALYDPASSFPEPDPQRRRPGRAGRPGTLRLRRPITQAELRWLGLRPRGQQLIDLSRWPAEPKAPRPVTPDLLAWAMQQLCPVWIQPWRIRQYAHWVVRYSQQFGVDPTLLAALIYQQSRCQARRANSYGVGLTRINPAMHRPFIVRGAYRYWVRSGPRWAPRSLPLDRFHFSPATLLDPEANIYYSAAFLAVFQAQCPDLDPAFGSVPHRHPVSHFIWGDGVRDAGVEDQVLRARRRLLEYYSGKRPVVLGNFRGLALASPVDGPPRKITSGLGDDRDGGRRRHTGLDFSTDTNEPVRAVAAGVVVLAGVDMGRGQMRSLPPALTSTVAPARMGPRGLTVQIHHSHGLVTNYMHLSAYVVRTGQKVQRGALLGYVGRSGMRESDAHLHFSMEAEGKHLDPIPYLGPLVFAPELSYFGRRKAAMQNQRRMRRRRLRRLRRGLSAPDALLFQDSEQVPIFKY